MAERERGGWVGGGRQTDRQGKRQIAARHDLHVLEGPLLF